MPDRSVDLVEQTRQLLEPGEIDLVGIIVETGLTPANEHEMIERTVEIGNVIAARSVGSPTYVYSGNDDPEFGRNQHQGRTVDGDDFIWECQQVLQDGTFRLVFYYEDGDHHIAIVRELRDRGNAVVDVRP